MEQRITAPFLVRGIDAVGACSIADLPGLAPASGKRLPPNAQSLLVCLLPYYPGEYPGRNVGRYAVCDDYHTAGGTLLAGICAELAEAFPGHTFVPFLDVSPIPEVEAARLAGLGCVGRHNMLISPRYGSYVFIAEVATDLEIAPSAPTRTSCLGCGACLQACPGGALGDRGFDKSRCRSFLSQKKGALEPWEAELIQRGGFAWGCDLCLEACPLNKAELTPLPAMAQNPVPVLTWGNLGEMVSRKAYGWRGKGPLERNLRLIST